MSLPMKVLAVRLPLPLADKLQRLTASFNLPPSTVVKMLLAAQLERPFEEQVQTVAGQIIKPCGVEWDGKHKRVDQKQGDNGRAVNRPST